MKMRRSLFQVVACAIALSQVASAQEQPPPLGTLSGTVQSLTGEGIYNARVRITSPTKDTVVRTNARGVYTVLFPRGPAQITVTMIGYQPSPWWVEVEAITTQDVAMVMVPQQLSAVDVRAKWIGVRGVVGDDSTMRPLANVLVRSIKRGISVHTDSLGRFEFSLPKKERTTIQLSLDDYFTRPAVVELDTSSAADVVLLMTRGRDPKHMKQSLVDLSSRLGWGGINMFVADRQKLSQQGAKYLLDGIAASGMSIRKGIVGAPCLFVDGVASPGMDAGAIRVADVEFVEVWGYNIDDTRSLQTRWPGGYCNPSLRKGGRGDGPWISVWLRK